jgi:tagaturonate reductase
MATRPQLNELLLDSARLRKRTDIVLPKDEHFEYPERAIQFGTGAFLRGFVDYFLDCANHRGVFGGRVVAVGSTGSGRDQAFADQDGLYTLVSRGIQNGAASESIRIVSAVSRALSATTEWEAVLEVARSADLEFIFSNTTEVGIVDDPADTAEMSPPRSFPAKLARFLIERARAFQYDAAWTVVVLPCELIENNGDRLREIVVRHARRWQVEPEFFNWLDAAVPFCNTLVDRIVPGAPTGAARAEFEQRLGYDDALLTSCEPYRLFAIEATPEVRSLLRFADADPGIIIDEDIAPYRERKVRLLNGAHTLMVPVALGIGAGTVREAVEHPAIGRFVRTAMLEEIAPYLEAPGASRFASEVLERFANPHVIHLLADITLQATMKMRLRVVPSIVRYAETTGRVPPTLTFGFAAHLWLSGGEAAGAPVTGRADDQGAALRTLWGSHGAGDPADAIRRVAAAACSTTALWDRDLGRIPGFCDAVASHLVRIRSGGMAAALDQLLTTSR